MVLQFVSYDDQEMMLSLVKQQLAEKSIPIEIVGLYEGDDNRGVCDIFVNEFEAIALFEEEPDSRKAENAVLYIIKEQIVNAADELARHGVKKMCLIIPRDFRLFRKAFFNELSEFDGEWRADTSVYFSAFKNGRQVYPLFDADGRVSSVTYAE